MHANNSDPTNESDPVASQPPSTMRRSRPQWSMRACTTTRPTPATCAPITKAQSVAAGCRQRQRAALAQREEEAQRGTRRVAHPRLHENLNKRAHSCTSGHCAAALQPPALKPALLFRLLSLLPPPHDRLSLFASCLSSSVRTRRHPFTPYTRKHSLNYSIIENLDLRLQRLRLLHALGELGVCRAHDKKVQLHLSRCSLSLIAALHVPNALLNLRPAVRRPPVLIIRDAWLPQRAAA